MSTKTLRSPEVDDSATFKDEATMPMGVGESTEGAMPEFLASSGKRRRISSGSILVAGVVIVAAASLFVMRSLTRVSMASAGNGKYEKDIDSFLKDARQSKDTKGKLISKDTVMSNEDDVLRVLSTTYTERQVPLANIQKNPFVLFEDEIISTGSGQTIDQSGALADLRNHKRTEIEKAAAGFQLKSIMKGDSPIANINGKILRIGDTIDSADGGISYTLASIGDQSATLVAEVPSIELKVSVTLTVKRDF
ncbi:MAG TPA: hypothetical protein VG711_06195 [Phycisphaerales bacterium]|nr:hypothetical protein [Phycisphaerales bacterium]